MQSVNVFMSYARADDIDKDEHGRGQLSRFADRLVANATALGVRFRLFRDEVGLEAGAEWETTILHEVHSADILLAFISPAFRESKYCPLELEAFLTKQAERGIAPPPVLWVRLPGVTDADLTELKVAPLQQLLDGGDLLGATDGPAEPGHIAALEAHAAAALHRRASALLPHTPRPGRPEPKPLPEQFQYNNALDSVRTQRGCTDQIDLVQARIKLAYLLGYTTVLTQSQAFDSLGAISCVSQAARAWRAGSRTATPPVVPFRVAHFRKVQSHMLDLAMVKLTSKTFESSAWYAHQRHRDASRRGTVDLAEAQKFTKDWADLQVATRFLRWFPCAGLADLPSQKLPDRLRYLASRAGRDKLEGPLVRDMRRLAAHQTLDRSELYAAIDGWDRSGDDVPTEPLKDLVDMAYDLGNARSVLAAATPDRHRRSVVLTDPTPDSPSEPQQVLMAGWLVEHDSEAEAELLQAHLRVVGAAEGLDPDRHDPAMSSAPLDWETVFELVSHPEWIRLRNRLIEARQEGALGERTRDAICALGTWICEQLRGRVHVVSRGDCWALALTEGDVCATVGHDELARIRATGVASL